MSEILDDFKRLLVPGLTHWNRPGFMAYFPSTKSGPGVLAEFLTAALNQLFALRVGPEERMMLKEFGKDCEAYMTRTKRLVRGVW